MHQGQVFKVFLQAVRDRSLFKSEVRWEKEKNMLLPSGTGFAEETASPEKSTAMGSPLYSSPACCESQNLIPKSSYFSKCLPLPSFTTVACPAWPSVWAAALQTHPKPLPPLELSSPVALYQLKCSCKIESQTFQKREKYLQPSPEGNGSGHSNSHNVISP